MKFLPDHVILLCPYCDLPYNYSLTLIIAQGHFGQKEEAPIIGYSQGFVNHFVNTHTCLRCGKRFSARTKLETAILKRKPTPIRSKNK